MRKGNYLPAALVTLVCFLAISCGRAKIMSVSKMSDIYAEMFIADQWLNDNPKLKSKADTMQFYGAIFERYGYSFKDYDASVNYYLAKPEKYNKIMKLTTEKLKKQSESYKNLEEAIDKQNRILKGLSVLHLPEFNTESIIDDTTLFWTWRDTLSVDTLVLDSLALDSLRRDSLRLDSLRLDSLRLDSLRRDSLKLDSLRKFVPRPLEKPVGRSDKERQRIIEEKKI